MTVIELDVTPPVAAVDVETPSVSISQDAAEVVGLVIAQGPPGTPGPQGEQGEQGPPGPSYDGVAWWYGEGPPGTVVGSKPGDFYLDTTTGNIYKLGD